MSRVLLDEVFYKGKTYIRVNLEDFESSITEIREQFADSYTQFGGVEVIHNLTSSAKLFVGSEIFETSSWEVTYGSKPL